MSNIQVKTWLANSPTEIEGAEHWQVLRELNAEEYTALKSGIAERGIDHALALDTNGSLIDGHHRKKVWAELLEEGVELPPVTVKQYSLTDANEIRLLARKLNMQRRQLTQLEKNEIIKQQLRETWYRSDRWIGGDLGVKNETVAARRRELIELDGQFGHLPEKVWSRPSKRYPEGQELAYADRRKPANKPKQGKAKPSTGQAPKTVTDALDKAVAEIEKNGTAPADAPSWPAHPAQETESEASKRTRQISSWMAGLSQIDPKEAADAVEERADIQARLVIAEEVIDWFGKYRAALEAKTDQPKFALVK